MADYREAPLATRPKTLDPAEYFNLSLDQRRAEEERAGLRAQLKRQYQMQLNNPHRKELITSLLGGLFGVVPLFVLYYVLKTDRDKKEEQIKAGTYDRKFKLAY
ncbi:unnamed protein product [Coregonus sp. 'balchen']|nr:unnamed protein product [Coregonus sp. 'balchen']